MATVEQLMDQYGLHWFKFDESSGNALDSKGTAVGTVNAGATRVTGWNGLGKAVKFNRTSTSNIVFNNRIIPTGDFTLRFKMKMTTKPSAENQAVFSTAFSTADNTGLRIWVDVNGYITFTACRKSNGNYDFTIIGAVDFDSKWHDYMMTWDTVKRVVKVYKDEVLFGIATSVTSNTAATSYNLRIGRQADSGEQRYFNGEIDDVQVYNKVLELSDFSKKYLIVKSNDNKTYELSPTNNRVKELLSDDENEIITQGLYWKDIDSSYTSNNIDTNASITEYEIYGKDNDEVDGVRIFNLPISNFKTVKIEGNY